MEDETKTHITTELADSNIAFHNETTITSWVANPYLQLATSNNTRKAYRSDIKQYEMWGGKLPATPELVVNYLQAQAASKNSRTLARRLIAIRHWHNYQGFPDPTAHPLVAKTMIGITRTHGKPKEKALPLLPEDLQKMVTLLAQDSSLITIRDNALLQIGYFGALRRSEIINIHYEHITWQTEGIEILLPASKTDQTHEGQHCSIPYGNDLLCPVTALETWLQKSNIKQGAIFRRVTQNKIMNDSSLTPLAVNHIIQRCAKLANLSNSADITPHSLRRGLATSAARAKASIQTIMRAGRWKQVNTVMEYIEASERFSDSAATSVLVNMKNNVKKEP